MHAIQKRMSALNRCCNSIRFDDGIFFYDSALSVQGFPDQVCFYSFCAQSNISNLGEIFQDFHFGKKDGISKREKGIKNEEEKENIRKQDLNINCSSPSSSLPTAVPKSSRNPFPALATQKETSRTPSACLVSFPTPRRIKLD